MAGRFGIAVIKSRIIVFQPYYFFKPDAPTLFLKADLYSLKSGI